MISIHLNFIHWNHNEPHGDKTHSELFGSVVLDTRIEIFFRFNPLSFFITCSVWCTECNVYLSECKRFIFHRRTSVSVYDNNKWQAMSQHRMHSHCLIMICLRNSPPTIRVIIRSSSFIGSAHTTHTQCLWQSFLMILMQSLNGKERDISRWYPSVWINDMRMDWVSRNKTAKYIELLMLYDVPNVYCTLWIQSEYTHCTIDRVLTLTKLPMQYFHSLWLFSCRLNGER